ncbi:hypothetical protein ACWDXT_06250 [Streptomyces sp. NPDC003236]
MTHPGGSEEALVPRSRLADYADMTPPLEGATPQLPDTVPDPHPGDQTDAEGFFDAGIEARRREFTAALEAFRDTAVLIPLRNDGWLTVDFGGVRWILAFSDEPALARYALTRNEGHLEWTYETVLGARLLDSAVPEAGVPCGVALDAADDQDRALLLPPVAGIVPDAYAVDRGFVGSTVLNSRIETKSETQW